MSKSMTAPRGSVYLTEESYELAIETTPGEKRSVRKWRVAWRGLIHGNGKELWGGGRRRSRSEAFADMRAANTELGLGAVLMRPIPDEPATPEETA